MDHKAVLAGLADKPGVYRMMDSMGNIIYVGKAKNLKKRVSQYFRGSKAKDPKIADLVRNARSVEWTVTDTELDALIEECRLIRAIKPRYNSRMKNTKGYTYIRIPDEPFPRLAITSEREDDGAVYLGPFATTYRVGLALGFLNDHFRLRKCQGPNLPKKPNGCLYGQIGFCLAPCTGRVGVDAYGVQIHDLKLLLNGRSGRGTEALNELKRRINEASEALEFEKAAQYQEVWIGIDHIINRQRLAKSSNRRRNIVAVERIEGDAVKVFWIKGNRLLHRESFTPEDQSDKGFPTRVARLTLDAFTDGDRVPELTQNDIDEAQTIMSYLRHNKDRIRCHWVTSTKLAGGVRALAEAVAGIIDSMNPSAGAGVGPSGRSGKATSMMSIGQG